MSNQAGRGILSTSQGYVSVHAVDTRSDQHSEHSNVALKVGGWTVLPDQNRLRNNGTEKSLQFLTMQLLVYLAEHRNRIVSQKEILETIWKGRVTGDYSVHGRIADLRRALGDDAKNPRYIETISKRGYRLIAPVRRIRSSGSYRRTRTAVAAAFLVFTVGAVLVWVRPQLLGRVADPATAGAAVLPSVAVLPFEILGPESADYAFATGLQDEFIDRLGRIDGLRVISRQSVQGLTPSATTMQDLARDLDVDAVVSGTLSSDNGIVWIRASLVAPANGDQLWSDTYERNFANIFELQSDVAESVAGAIGVKLGVDEVNAFRGAGTTNIDAYEAFLAGLHALNREQGQDRAFAFFQQATELDSGYAAAWAQMGFAVAARTFFSPPERTEEVLDRAMPFLLRAVELDPRSSRSSAMLGFVRYFRLDWVGAENDYTRAIDLQASRLTLAQHAGLLARAGRLAAARSEFEAAESMESSFGRPAPVQIQVSIGQGRYAEARQLAAMDEVLIRRQHLLLNIALNEGDPDAIREAMSGLLVVHQATTPLYSRLLSTLDSPVAALAAIRAVYDEDRIQWPSKRQDIALTAAYFGELQLAVKAISEEVGMTRLRMSALWYPMMADVRKLPEFKELVSDLNLVAYWRRYGWPDACAPLGEADFTCW